VPFQLGRPLGPPGDRAFQRRVVLAALRLLEAKNGPVIIEDFAADDPRERSDTTWRPPSLPTASADREPTALAAQLEAEIAQLADAHRRWIAARGRTTVGLSGLSPPELGPYIAEWLRGRQPPGPRAEVSPILSLRFAADDLKAYVLEAGAAGPGQQTGKPSSRQLYDWFWQETAAGAALIALLHALLAGDNDRIKLIAGNFLVPPAFVPSTDRPATITATSLDPWRPGQ
jgi:hypothetical protein